MGNLCASGAKPANHQKSKARSDTTTNGVAHANGLKGGQGTHHALKILGSGTAADTWLFEDHELSAPVAIKMFKRPITVFGPEAVLGEVQTQSELGPGHINLINVFTLFLSADCLGLVMECAEGGSLSGWLEKKLGQSTGDGLIISEDEALYLFRQIISAVAYCHAHGIAHRDLKLDNTLLDGSNPPVIKICDFGFASRHTGHVEVCQSQLGTPEYMSPELLHKTLGGKDDTYDGRKSDAWAVGVILVVLLCGAFPFDSNDHKDSTDKEGDLWREELNINWKDSPHLKKKISKLSPEVRDLLDNILNTKPEERFTLEDIKKHAWYQRKLPSKYQAALDKLQEQQHGLEEHVSRQKFNKAKMRERETAMRKMVDEAFSEGDPKGKRVSTDIRPTQAFDFRSPQIQQIDLTQKNITEDSARTDSEAQIVRERFERVSVAAAVQSAFEGGASKDLHDAAQARQS